MYGSKKPGCSAYKLTHILNYNKTNERREIDVDEILERNGGERWLLTQLRIKREQSESPPIIAEKQKDFEEEEMWKLNWEDRYV